jgi:hypothetical protein
MEVQLQTGHAHWGVIGPCGRNHCVDQRFLHWSTSSNLQRFFVWPLVVCRNRSSSNQLNPWANRGWNWLTCAAPSSGLTIHSSRRRFAARLNSGVRPQTARSWPRAVGISSIASLIHLRPASGITQTRYASGWGAVRVVDAIDFILGGHTKTRRPWSNNSLKPSPLRGLGAGAMIEPSPRPQIGPGLAQALGVT